MRKYLIQDITPAGRKHALHPHKTKDSHVDEDDKHAKKAHAHSTAHPVHTTTHPAHKIVHHVTRHTVKKEEHDDKEDDVVVPAATPVVAVPVSSTPPVLPATTSPSETVVATATVVTPTESLTAVVPPTTDSPIPKLEQMESDPRTMLVDKIIEPMEEEKIIHHTPSYFSDAVEVELPAKAWHYSSGSKENTTSYTPPVISQPTGVPTVPKIPKPWKTWIPWIMGMVIIVALGIVGLNYYSGVTVSVIQKHDSIPLDEKITAFKTPQSGELSYAVVIATSSVSREVTATEEKVVTEKASGKIIVYNTQKVPQRLIKNTRFQSLSGKIYRIPDSINVPKASVVGGKDVPGSIEVTVFADEAGPDYNLEPTDFTIPGLKGTKFFDLLYARSQGAITGGATGATKSIVDQDLKLASEELRVQLETKLRSEARSSVSSWATEINYDSGVVVELGEIMLPNIQSSDSDKAVVTQDGTIYLITFDRKELTDIIVKKLIPTYNGEAVEISNLETLSVEIPQMSGVELMASEKLSISLKGTPSLEWTVDETEIKNAILGISKTDFNSIMSQFPTVERAKAIIRPVWKTTFPVNPDDIAIEIVPSIPE